jgi:sulfate adenylyltransferase subunit 1
VGEEIVTLPSNEKAHVKSLHILDKEVDTAGIGQPVTIQLDREVDVSRGCVLSVDSNVSVTSAVAATLLWMDDVELEEGKNFFVKLGTKLIPGTVRKIRHTIDVNTGEQKPAATLHKNEIAVCELSFADEIVVDLFENHKTLGELILIDRVTNMTSACGVVAEILDDTAVVNSYVDREARSNFKGQRAVTVEFPAGTAGIDYEFVQKVEKELSILGRHTYLYAPKEGEDAANVVKHLNNAGIVVLIYTDGTADAEFARNRSYVSGWIEGDTLTVDAAVDFVYKKSGIHSAYASNGEYI